MPIAELAWIEARDGSQELQAVFLSSTKVRADPMADIDPVQCTDQRFL